MAVQVALVSEAGGGGGRSDRLAGFEQTTGAADAVSGLQRGAGRPVRSRKAGEPALLDPGGIREFVALVRGSDVVAVSTDDAHVIGSEPCLDPEGASGPSLAGKAVAKGDPDRISLRCQTKLPTATGGLARRHRRRILGTVARRTSDA